MCVFVYGNVELWESRIEVLKICGESSIEDGENRENPILDVLFNLFSLVCNKCILILRSFRIILKSNIAFFHEKDASCPIFPENHLRCSIVDADYSWGSVDRVAFLLDQPHQCFSSLTQQTGTSSDILSYLCGLFLGIKTASSSDPIFDICSLPNLNYITGA